MIIYYNITDLLKKLKIPTLFVALLFSNIFPANSADININSTTYSNQLFSENNQKMIIGSNGNVNGNISFNGKTNLELQINASANNGILSTGTAVQGVSLINLNSGIIKTTSSFAIRNITDEDLTVNIASGAILSNNNVTIFAYKPSSGAKNVNINNAGIISGRLPIFFNNSKLNLQNSGTISSEGPSFNVIYSHYMNDSSASITNHSSGIINGKMLLQTKNASLLNNGIINGNIEIFDHDYAHITNNSGSLTGNIAMGFNNNSSFTLNNGSVIGDIKIAADEKGGMYGDFRGYNQAINLNGGFFNGDIYMVPNSVVNLGSTIFNGNITADSYLPIYSGTVNLNASRILNSNINLGPTIGLDTINIANGVIITQNGSLIKSKNLNINSGGTLNLASDLNFVNNITTFGTLNFGNNSRIVNGNIIGGTNGKINIGTASHIINGNLTINNGNVIAVGISNNGLVGKVTTSGSAIVDSGAKLSVNLGSGYISSGSKYTIIDGGSGSNIAKINDSNINVNNSSSNSFSVFTFNTNKSDAGDDLILNVNRKPAASVTSNKNAQDVYQVINNIGSSAAGKLKEFQQYIDSSNNVEQISEALKSVTAQDGQATQLNSISVVNGSIKTIENRMDSLHIASIKEDARNNNIFSYKKDDTLFINKIAKAKYELTNMYSGDGLRNQDIWGQVFGTSAKQGNKNDNGYKSNAAGFAFGTDKEVSKNSRIGVALSYANSNVKSSDGLKYTDIDSYQINLYGGKSFDKYFWDGVLGFVWNEYHATRLISSINSIANAEYNSQNYVMKLRGGFVHNFASGLNIAPEVSSTFIDSRTNNYTEKGADSVNLQVRKNSDQFLEGRIGFNLGYEAITKKGTKILPKFNASYGYNFLNGKQVTISNFVGQTATFNSISSKVNSASFKFGVGFDIVRIDSITLSSDYIMERRGNYVSHSGLFKAKHEF